MKRPRFTGIRLFCLIGAGTILLAGSIVFAAVERHTALPLKEKIIFIDAGHGGYDPGAIGRFETVEKDLNLRIARLLQGYLEIGGATVYMTRVDDSDLAGEATDGKKRRDMAERIRQVEESGAALLISIHQNTYTDSRYWGPQVFYSSRTEEAREIALAVQDALNSFTAPECTRVVKEGDGYYILKNAPAPAILVECGFITNAREEKLLSDENYQKKVAWGIYSGILESFG